jgi:hypothetical protein
MNDKFLLVMVSADEVESSDTHAKSGNLRDGLIDRLATARRLNIVDLELKMHQFLMVVGRLFRQAEQQAQMTEKENPLGRTSHLQLDEVEMSIEITAGGEVKLIAGGRAETKGTIKLKFKRVD